MLTFNVKIKNAIHNIIVIGVRNRHSKVLLIIGTLAIFLKIIRIKTIARARTIRTIKAFRTVRTQRATTRRMLM